MADPIKKITLGDGTVRYRFVIDVGKDPRRASADSSPSPRTPRRRRRPSTPD